MDTYNGKKRAFVLFLKYSPTVGVFCFMVHYLLIPFGIYTIMPDYIIDLSVLAYAFLMLSSWLFGFCRLHRAFITYIAVATLDVDLHHFVSLGLLPGHLIPALMFGTGCALFWLLIRRRIIAREARK